jgi:hypothetical protein
MVFPTHAKIIDQQWILEHTQRLLNNQQLILEHTRRLLNIQQWILEHTRRLLNNRQWILEHTRRLLNNQQWILEHTRRLLSKQQWILEDTRRLLNNQQWISEHTRIIWSIIFFVIIKRSFLPLVFSFFCRSRLLSVHSLLYILLLDKNKFRFWAVTTCNLVSGSFANVKTSNFTTQEDLLFFV